MKRNIVLCGVGGQGILLAAKIIAAAAELRGYEVSTHEIHGMAQRGGSVTAQVRYGERVHSPLILEGTADILASLEAIEAIRYAHYLRADALAVISRQRLIPVTVSTGQASYPEDIEASLSGAFSRYKYLDVSGIAASLGNERMSNTVLLGALSTELDEIPAAIWEQAINACVKPVWAAMNITAFKQGRTL
jgi:indolepyruvate ferredoxin oxidoreductase beta subunit